MSSTPYALAHKMRKKAKKTAPSGTATMRIEGVDDPTDEKFPLVPPEPEQPQLPVDDKYYKLRTQHT